MLAVSVPTQLSRSSTFPFASWTTRVFHSSGKPRTVETGNLHGNGGGTFDRNPPRPRRKPLSFLAENLRMQKLPSLHGLYLIDCWISDDSLVASISALETRLWKLSIWKIMSLKLFGAGLQSSKHQRATVRQIDTTPGASAPLC